MDRFGGRSAHAKQIEFISRNSVHTTNLRLFAFQCLTHLYSYHLIH